MNSEALFVYAKRSLQSICQKCIFVRQNKVHLFLNRFYFV